MLFLYCSYKPCEFTKNLTFGNELKRFLQPADNKRGKCTALQPAHLRNSACTCLIEEIVLTLTQKELHLQHQEQP